MLLIVEDHEDSGRMLCQFLERHGYQCVLVKTGAEGLAMAKLRKFIAVILDYYLPDMDGLEVLREIREDPSIADLPVFFFSASFQSDIEKEAKRLGALNWLVKGVHGPKQLAETISRMVGARPKTC